MKKGNRVLAMFLAAVLLVTSIVWDFGDAAVAEAETTSAITKTDDSLSIDFDNIDVAELDAAGYTSTRFNSSAAIAGEVNRKVSEHWFAGDDENTLYTSGNGTNATGKNIGLKSNDVAATENRTVMYTDCSYEDFTVSAEIYYGAYSGIVIGEKNVYPTISSDTSSVAIFFNSGRLHIVGAVDRDSASIMRGSSAAIANNGNAVGYKIFNNGSGDTIKTKAGTAYTVNVKKTGNHLLIWYSGGTGLISIKLTDSYKTGAIGIQSKCYDGDAGGFKSLSIEKVHATETHNLKDMSMQQIDDLGHSASMGTTLKLDSVGDAWFSGKTGYLYDSSTTTVTSANDGLKGRATGGSIAGLNIPYVYENFRLEAELYHGQLTGVSLGVRSGYPQSSLTTMTTNTINLYFNSAVMEACGAIQVTSEDVVKADYSSASTSGTGMYKLTTKDATGKAFAGTRDTKVTLIIEVKDGMFTMAMKGYDGYVSIPVASGYKPEKVSLISRHKSGDKGGIISYTITNLDAGDAADFDNVNLSNLDAAGYTASKSSAPSTTSSVSTHWFSGYTDTYKAETETYANVGLKSLNNDSNNPNARILNLPQVYDNFRLEANVYPGQVLGVQIGVKEKGIQVGGGNVSSGSVSIYINGSYLAIAGAIDYATRYGTTAGTTGFIQYTPTGNTTQWSGVRTLIIEVQDGILSVSYADLDHVLKVELASSYKTENIALFARRYSTSGGSAGGGFKSYTLEKLPSVNTGTTANIAGYTDFEHIDTTALDAKGFTSTRFDRNNNYAVLEENQLVGNHWFAGNGGMLKYEDASVVTAGNIGLKPNQIANDLTMTILNTPTVYENYRASLEVYWGASTGLVLGAKNVFPVDHTTSDSVKVYFNANQTQIIGGGVDFATGAVFGGDGSSSIYEEDTYIFKPGASYSATKAATYKLNVEVLDGILSVWVDGYDSMFKIQLTDTFKNESIAIMARQYDSDGGGIKSFEIIELESVANDGTTVDVDGYTDFDNVDSSVLDAKGFSATQFDASSYEVVQADQSVSTYWAVGNEVTSENKGIKPNTLGTENKITYLNTPYNYTDFRISTEVYWGANAGIVIGAKNVFPLSSTDTSLRIYFNANQLQLGGGAIDPDSAVITGSGVWNRVYEPTYIFKPASGYTATKGEVYKLNVEMKDGTLTVWLDGCDGILTVNTTPEFRAVENKAIALMARQYDGDGGGFKSLTVKEIAEDIAIPYTAEEFATYRSATGHKAPNYKNYLFAGWYTDAACDETQAVSSSATTVDAETVYAKFVPRHILTVKAQISAELTDGNIANNTKGNIRFATTVDSLNYSKVGFKIAYDRNGDKVDDGRTVVSNEVYAQLNAIGGITYVPTDFSGASTYFKACTVKNIGEDFYDLEFTVTPFWKTLDGTEVNGDVVVKTINQGMDVKFLDNKTALFVGDSIQAGNNISGEGALPVGWAQRLSQRYGMVSENVAQKGWALTNTETSGRSQIVTQLDKAKQSTYDFVILEGGVNDVRIDQDNSNITIDKGTINEDPNATFSDDNIAGAMQDLIVKTQAKFPNAKIVYLINHYYGASETNMKNYVAMVKAACRVHNISYIDLSDTEAYPTLEPLTEKSAEYIPDNLHPSAAGYDLSTPVIATQLRKMLTGELTDTVYVASTGTDATGYGTESAPYQSLNYAIKQVDDGGTIFVQDTLTLGDGTTSTSYRVGEIGGDGATDNPKVNNKQVTIAGSNSSAKLDFSAEQFLLFNDSIILKDIQIAWADRVFAEGNTVIVQQSVVQTGSKEPMFIAGSNAHDLDKTDLRLYSGTYKKIIGGQMKNTVGETNVIVGGSVNSGIDTSSHDHTYVLFGGNYTEGAACTVTGDTNVTVESGARFNYVYGAGAKAQNVADSVACAVQGETNVTFAGEAYGVYGGACGRLTGSVDKVVTCGNTNVKIVDGANVAQVFGGSEYASVSGSTNVQLLGGKIRRRVFGGCYNEDSVETVYYANGNTIVTIDPAVTLTLNEGSCQSLAAISRCEMPSATETGIFVFNNYTANTTNIGKIGIDSILQSWYGFDSKTHDHIVKVGANGSATVVDGKLVVTPNSGYAASVTGATDNGDGTYTLTATEVIVTFSASN